MTSKKQSFRVLLLLTAFLLASAAFALDYKYVGSKNSLIYHYPHCIYAKIIKPGHLVTFKSAGEAKNAGYLPCVLCKPPGKD